MLERTQDNNDNQNSGSDPPISVDVMNSSALSISRSTSVITAAASKVEQLMTTDSAIPQGTDLSSYNVN